MLHYYLTFLFLLCVACDVTPAITEPDDFSASSTQDSASSQNQQNGEQISDSNNNSPDLNQEEDPVDDFTPPAPVFYRSEFNSLVQTNTVKQSVAIDELFYAYTLLPQAKVASGLYDSQADDKFVAQVMFPGDPLLAGNKRTGPGLYGTHLESDFFGQLYHYGSYKIRFRAPTCLSDNEGVISGLFTYLNDGLDTNQNGLMDNSEIDIEISCNEPSHLYLSIWTDYNDDSAFIKTTRRVDFESGTFRQTKAGKESFYGLESTGNLPFKLDTLDFRSGFHEIKMVWQASSVAFYYLAENQEYLLWKFTNSQLIPKRPSYYMMNLWHSATLWNSDLLAQYPDHDVELLIDWFEFIPIENEIL